jgi:hypothetical protein
MCQFLALHSFAHNKCMCSQLVRYAAANLCLLFFPLSTFSVSTPTKVALPSPLNPGYVSALAVADRFLQAWQAGDAENGIAMLTEHAKKGMNPDDLDKFFSASDSSAYEVDRGKRMRRGHYEFPVVLVNRSANKLHRKFSSIVIVNTSNNEWAVDKLP